MPSRRRASIRLRCAAAAVAALVVGALAGPSGATEVVDDHAATCNGRTPTMTGSPGTTVLGTADDDVIITNGASRVDSGAGNDAICVTGKGTVVVNAGPGDDSVDARGHKARTFVSLGFGDDSFVGGEGADRVWSQEASNQTSTDDHDVILTNEGDDYVISGSSAASDNDLVQLGPGNDTLVTYGSVSGANLSGGLGLNTYQPLPGSDLSGEWTFDNVEGEAALGVTTELAWSAFQRFDLTGVLGSKLRFLGSRADETVLAGGTCRVVLRGRAGDDRLTVDSQGCNNLPAGDAVLVGGPGDDRLTGAGGDDVLRGGGGRDIADGGLGSNRCVAVEVPTSCTTA